MIFVVRPNNGRFDIFEGHRPQVGVIHAAKFFAERLFKDSDAFAEVLVDEYEFVVGANPLCRK